MLPGQLDMFPHEYAAITDDEMAVLLIAAQGEYMIPIGRWESPTKSLAEKGLLRKIDDVNYVITSAGADAAEKHDKADFQALFDASNKLHNASAQYQQSCREAAKHLVVAAKAAAIVTGVSPVEALKKLSLETIKLAKSELEQ